MLSGSLLVLVWVLRKLRNAGDWVPEKIRNLLHRDGVAVGMTLVGSEAAALLAALQSGEPMSLDLFLRTLEIAAAASGIFSWLKVFGPQKKADG